MYEISVDVLKLEFDLLNEKKKKVNKNSDATPYWGLISQARVCKNHVESKLCLKKFISSIYTEYLVLCK